MSNTKWTEQTTAPDLVKVCGYTENDLRGITTAGKFCYVSEYNLETNTATWKTTDIDVQSVTPLNPCLAVNKGDIFTIFQGKVLENITGPSGITVVAATYIDFPEAKELWVIIEEGEIWKKKLGSSDWEQVPGSLKSISAELTDSQEQTPKVWGFNKDFNVYAWDNANHGWRRISPGSLKSISANKLVVGIGVNDLAYLCDLENNRWVRFDNTKKFIDICTGTMTFTTFAIDTNNRLWRFNGM